MSEDSIISLQNVNKWFGDFHVLKDVDLQVKKNKALTLTVTACLQCKAERLCQVAATLSG